MDRQARRRSSSARAPSTTDDAVAFAAAGAEAGAVAAMILTPKVFADDPAGMRDFYRAVHARIRHRHHAAECARADGHRAVAREGGRARARGGRHPLRQGRSASFRSAHHEAHRTGRRFAARRVRRRRRALRHRRADARRQRHDARVRDHRAARRDVRSIPSQGRCRRARSVRAHAAAAQHAGDVSLAADQGSAAAPRTDRQHVRARAGPELDRYDRLELDALLARLADLLPLEVVAA